MILFALAAAAWHWLLQDIVPVYQIKGISKLFKLCLPKVQCFCDSLTSPPSERQSVESAFVIYIPDLCALWETYPSHLDSSLHICIEKHGVQRKCRGDGDNFFSPKKSIAMATIHEILCKLKLEGTQSSSSTSALGTVRPSTNFDAEKDAAALETAIKTKGVDELTIINILTNRSNDQRQDIAFAYQRRTKKGLGTDEDTLIEIICSRDNPELQAIQAAYRELFKTELEKDIVSDTSGDFRKLMVALAKGKRQEESNVVDYEKIDQDARDLYEAGVKRKGTDVSKWISIMTERSIPHLQKVFERYKSYSPYDMQESIKKEVKGDLENAFVNLVQSIQNKPLYFADRLYDSMKGKGTKDKVLIRNMVSRSEVDMLKIRAEFKKKYGKSLSYFIGVSITWHIFILLMLSHTAVVAGEITIAHVTNCSSKFISKGAIDIKFSSDVGNNPSNPHRQRNKTIDVHV
ncbi:unnamed protein product [Ranitomeya imitator]|uniref:Annexin n=1 Tax=Ranitomeya imitator TaxID=111125 RepID=A0ABN9MK45_9NEOB|nr:unnamed protein product [Ranitomeya imitator]